MFLKIYINYFLIVNVLFVVFLMLLTLKIFI
jgi:hypothetical protein